MASHANTLLPRPGQAPLRVIEKNGAPSERPDPRTFWAGLLLLGLAAFVYMGLLTQGAHLFDNDYDWIAAARPGWLEIFGQIFRPVPEDWGFQHRPVQVLCFKALYALFGYAPLPYYAFKGLLFTGLVCGIAIFCVRTGFATRVAFTAAGIFALSSPVFSSVLWVSDFELLAQLFILGAFGLFLAAERRNLYEADRFRFWLYQGGIFLLTLLGHRAKGSAKLIPAILLAYLLIYRRDALKRYLPLLALIALTIVPLFKLLDDPVPPFAPFSEDRSQGWMWKPANLTTLVILTVGNARLLPQTAGVDVTHSLFGVLYPVLFCVSLAAAGLLLYKRRARAPLTPGVRAATHLAAVWLIGIIASFSAFPRLPVEFMSRYLTGALVPAGILIALLLSRAADTFPSAWNRRVTALLTLLVLAHGIAGFDQVRVTRDYLGQIMIAYGRARAAISKTIRNANVLILNFTYSYNRSLDDGNRYITHRDRSFDMSFSRPLYVLAYDNADIKNLDHAQSAETTLEALRTLPRPILDRYRFHIRPVKAFHGLTDGIYDRWVYRSTRSELAILFHVACEPIDPHKGNEK